MEDQTDYIARSNIMWAANQALNTLISRGVKQDWATHSIGHELTANLGLDHGQTLAIVQPRVFELNFESKKEKLAMLGEVVFHLAGTTEEKALNAIKSVESFYRDILKVHTKISELDCDQNKDWIEVVASRLIKEEVKLGENRDIDGNKIRDLLHKCY